MRPIPRAQLVWTVLSAPAAGTTFQFPDVPELREREIIGIEAFNAGDLSNTPDLNAVIPVADSPKVALTLKDRSSVQRLRDVPIETLIAGNNGGIWKQVEPFTVNWQTSYIKVYAAIAGTVTVPLLIYYLPGS